MFTHAKEEQTWGEGAYVVFRPEAKDSDLAAMDILEDLGQAAFVGSVVAEVAAETRKLSPEYPFVAEYDQSA